MAHQRPRNPYYNFGIVRELDMFFGRKEELQYLLDLSMRGQCVSVVGTRYIGKSSLLYHMSNPQLHQQLNYGTQLQHHIFVPLDFKDFLAETRNGFFLEVCQHILAQCQHIPALAIIQLTSTDGEDRFKRVLKEISKASYHPVLLMDAFDNIVKNTQFDVAFFSFLRSQAEKALVSYITASSKLLQDVCRYELTSSPFFGIFATRTLGPLKETEARALIEVPAMHAQCPFTETEVDWILEQAGYHPFFLQITCQILFDEKCKQSDDSVNLKHVQEQVYKQLSVHFDHIRNDLPADQQQDLKREARQPTGSARKVPELSESALFRKRVRETGKIDQLDITADDVKEALEILSDNEALGQTKLADTNYVFLRHQSEHTSNNKKGIIVHSFLKAAFERLAPGSRRSETAPEWRLYNILYHRYFAPRYAANDIIQMRLEISSRRQFYREQVRAIQELLKELLELEEEALSNNEL